MSEVIWAPWRVDYILGEKIDGCVFCKYLDESDSDQNLILARTDAAFVIMNRYPYTSGHLMVLPKRHVADITELTGDEVAQIFELKQKCIKILRQELKPEGFNIGANLGRAAGAGIADHLHYHIVPRWVGDSNYMTSVGEVRVIPEHIKSTYAKLKPLF